MVGRRVARIAMLRTAIEIGIEFESVLGVDVDL